MRVRVRLRVRVRARVRLRLRVRVRVSWALRLPEQSEKQPAVVVTVHPQNVAHEGRSQYVWTDGLCVPHGMGMPLHHWRSRIECFSLLLGIRCVLG